MSDLGKAVLSQPGATVMATHIGKEYQACIEGALYPADDDSALIDRFWNPIAASWYPGGKGDPKMLMLKFVYEMAKANLTDTLPDVGKSKIITPDPPSESHEGLAFVGPFSLLQHCVGRFYVRPIRTSYIALWTHGSEPDRKGGDGREYGRSGFGSGSGSGRRSGQSL